MPLLYSPAIALYNLFRMDPRTTPVLDLDTADSCIAEMLCMSDTN